MISSPSEVSYDEAWIKVIMRASVHRTFVNSQCLKR